MEAVAFVKKDEQDRVARFLAAFNSIDQFLRKKYRERREDGFAECLDKLTREIGSNEATDFLSEVAQLRNVLIHSYRSPYRYIATPASEVVEKLETIEKDLRHPQRVGQKFAKRVEVVSISDSIESVLRKIDQYEISQFPVYDGATFKGLLTENGITRWLARHVVKESMIELKDETVRAALREQENRSAYTFVSANLWLAVARREFVDNRLLEALLITQTGKDTEELVGIMTRWDAVTKG